MHMKSAFKKILNSSSGIAILGLIFFALSYILILRNHPFITGDTGIIGLIASDIREGRFLSWFFYGQIYFGNFYPAVLAVLSLFSGLSINSIIFWDHLFFALTLIVLALRIRWPNPLFSVAFFVPLFFLNQFTIFSFALSYSFPIFIIIAFFALYEHLWSNQRYPAPWVWFLTGLFTTLSLWHFQLYIIIFPIFCALVILQFWFQGHLPKLQGFVAGTAGLIIGSIPFIFGGISTEWRSIEFFTSPKNSSALLDILVAARYYAIEFLVYFFHGRAGSIEYEYSWNFIRQIASNPTALIGLAITSIISAALLISLFKPQRNIVAYLFIAGITLLLLLRGVDNPNQIFSNIRYSMLVHIMLLFVAIRTLFEGWQLDYGFLKPKVYTSLNSVFVVLVLLLFIPSIISQASFRNGKHAYELAFDDLVELDARYVYCYNYWEICGQLAFLASQNDQLTVQILDPDTQIINNRVGRNPGSYGIVDQAVKDGRQVYTIASEFLAWSAPEDAVILEEYLFVGVKPYYLIDKPVICAPNTDFTASNPISGQGWTNCGLIENDFNEYKQSEQYQPVTIIDQ